jgi:hypothetical protein
MLADPGTDDANGHAEGVSAILRRPLKAGDVKEVVERGPGDVGMQWPLPGLADERRRRAVD